MQKTLEALKEGFEQIYTVGIGNSLEPRVIKTYRFAFGDGYELYFEPLLFDEQFCVALYKDKNLLTNKVVVKPGYGGMSE